MLIWMLNQLSNQQISIKKCIKIIQDVFGYKFNKIQASLQDSLIGRNLHAYPQIYVSVSCF